MWFDYVEGELDPSLKSDLKLHLQDCGLCQQNFSEFKTLRNVLEEKTKSNSKEIPSDDFFKKLEGKIMASLDKPVVEKAVAVAEVYAWTRRMILPVAATAALFLLVFGGLYRTMKFKAANTTERVQINLEEQFIVQAAYNDPEAISNAMISHEGVEEVVMNAAAVKLSRMSDQDAARF